MLLLEPFPTVQWGTYNCGSEGVTFPITFPHVCYGVLATRITPDDGDVMDSHVASFTTQKAFVKLGAYLNRNSFYADRYVFIIAVGE